MARFDLSLAQPAKVTYKLEGGWDFKAASTKKNTTFLF